MLGRYLASGAAGEQNPAEARMWLERAVAQGVPEAEADLAENWGCQRGPYDPVEIRSCRCQNNWSLEMWKGILVAIRLHPREPTSSLSNAASMNGRLDAVIAA